MAAMGIFAQAVDFNGVILSGAKLNVYDAGTTTPRAIYVDNGLATASANPAVATSTGGIAVWVDDTAGDIKIVLTNSAGTTTYYEQDNVDPTQSNVLIYPLGGTDQDLGSSSSVAFAGLTLSGNLDMQGNRIILDADNDSYLNVNSDDSVSLFVGGVEVMKLDAAASDVLTLDGVTFSPTGATVGQALGYPNSASTLEPYTPAGGGDTLKAADEPITGDWDFQAALNRTGQAIYDLAAYATLAAALTAISSTNARLYINSSETLSGNTTIPANVELAFGPSGEIATGAHTLTMNGKVAKSVSRQQIFDTTGGGSVTGTPLVEEVYPEWFGSLGTGSEEATMQEAADFAAAASCPLTIVKSHQIDGDINLVSRQQVIGRGDDAELVEVRISCLGTVGSLIAFTSGASAGDTSISIPTASVSDGSWLRIASVINSGSTDAGENRLSGDPTFESYIAEFVQTLDATTSSTSATLRRELQWPYSNSPGSDTADPLSGQSGGSRTSAAWVVTFCEDVHIRNLKMTARGPGTASEGMVFTRWAKNVTIEECEIDTNDDNGKCVTFEYSLDCTLLNSTLQGKITSVDSGTRDNPVVMTSCQNCTVRGGKIYGGNQGIDFTVVLSDEANYRGGPCLFCGVEGTYFSGQQTDAATSHPGNLGCFFKNCHGPVKSNGIRIRSTGDIAEGNRFFAGESTDGTGILFAGGYCRGAKAVGNFMRRGQRAIAVDPGDPTDWTLPVEVLIADNTAQFTQYAVRLVSPSSATNQYYGAKVTGNVSYSCTDSHILVEDYFNGAEVTGNRARKVAAAKAAVEYEGNQSYLYIDGNYSTDVDGSGYSVLGNGAAAITDTGTFSGGEADAHWYIGAHYGEGSASGISHGSTAYEPRQDLSPQVARFDQPVHVNPGDSGVTAANTADDMVLEGSAATGMSILAPAAKRVRQVWGSGADITAFIDVIDDASEMPGFSYTDTNPLAYFSTATSSGQLGIGASSTDITIFISRFSNVGIGDQTYTPDNLPGERLEIDGNINLDGASYVYKVNGTQVVGAQVVDADLAAPNAITAYAAPTISGTYTQSEVQAIADALETLRNEVADVRDKGAAANSTITTHGLGATS